MSSFLLLLFGIDDDEEIGYVPTSDRRRVVYLSGDLRGFGGRYSVPQREICEVVEDA
jgi:hypothetical protein